MQRQAIITFLGTGTSQGVPMIACQCEVCTSLDFRDKRLRSAIHIASQGSSIVIDTGPDFRQQMLRHRIMSLDGILFTHEHKDHIAGLDDVRGYNFKQNQPMQLFAQQRVLDRLQVEFAYAFGEAKYAGVPTLELHPVYKGEPFNLAGLSILPLEVMHHKLPILGYRFGDFAYITDAKTISPDQIEHIRGVKTLVLNGLQEEPHHSHFTIAEAVAMAEELKPEMCYLTHISHRLGKHVDMDPRLPKGVQLAYDGLQIRCNVS